MYRIVVKDGINKDKFLFLIKWMNENNYKLVEKNSSSLIISTEPDLEPIKELDWVSCVVSEEKYQNHNLSCHLESDKEKSLNRMKYLIQLSEKENIKLDDLDYEYACKLLNIAMKRFGRPLIGLSKDGVIIFEWKSRLWIIFNDIVEDTIFFNGHRITDLDLEGYSLTHRYYEKKLNYDEHYDYWSSQNTYENISKFE